MQSSDMHSGSGHMSEYLVAFARLVVNDSVAQYITNTCKIDATTDGLTFFNELLQKYNELTPDDLYLKHLSRIALFNIFSSFSYQATAQATLASDKKFVKIVKKASRYHPEKDVVIQTYLLQNLSSIKQAAEAILINLDLYKDTDVVRNDASAQSKPPHVMVSYSHKEVAFCRDLVRALRAHSLRLWVDEDGHCRSNDCWEEIALGIKHASYVLVIVSPSYCESVSCRKEATYADKRKKTLIALYPNDDRYEPDEWLDIRLTGTYVRFGSKGKSFETCIARLLEFIQPKEGSAENMVASKKIPVVQLSPIPTGEQSDEVSIHKIEVSERASEKPKNSLTVTKPSIQSWTSDDIQTWFLTERRVLPQLYHMYSFVDGDSLLEYAKYFLAEYERDAKQQYEQLRARLQKKRGMELYDNHYTDLVCSMKKLLLATEPPRLPATPTMQKASAICLIS